MKHQQISYTLNGNSRETIHEEIIELFLREEHGLDPQGKPMEYTYSVDGSDGYDIILTRPARLNRGMDFVILTNPSIAFQKYKKGTFRIIPSQKDIVECLKKFKEQMGNGYAAVASSIRELFDCLPVSRQLPNISLLDENGQPFSLSVVLLLVKWFFIEQDVTYWNYSGREMLFQALKNEGLV